ncbi:hypothetical protein GGU11DRAFT_765553, partial [Lentinula aff. detonsa]
MSVVKILVEAASNAGLQFPIESVRSMLNDREGMNSQTQTLSFTSGVTLLKDFVNRLRNSYFRSLRCFLQLVVWKQTSLKRSQGNYITYKRIPGFDPALSVDFHRSYRALFTTSPHQHISVETYYHGAKTTGWRGVCSFGKRRDLNRSGVISPLSLNGAETTHLRGNFNARGVEWTRSQGRPT